MKEEINLKDNTNGLSKIRQHGWDIWWRRKWIEGTPEYAGEQMRILLEGYSYTPLMADILRLPRENQLEKIKSINNNHTSSNGQV